MPPTHAHPNGLGASWWANPRMSTSSTSSYNQSGGMLDVTNRPRHTHDTNPRRERPRPRMRQRPIAPLGTREDVENENYVSPLGEMFTRAYGRYRIAEETRQQAFQVDQFRNDENARPNPLRSRAANHTDNSANQQVFLEQANYNMDPQYGHLAYPQWIQNAHTEFDRRRMGLVTPEQAMVEDARLFENIRTNELRQREEALQLTMDAIGRIQPHIPQPTQPIPPPQTRTLNLDDQPRPPARASEDMVVNIACTVCFEHPINVVLLPCWHACMCNWCADLCIPTRRSSPYARPPTDYTGKCPKCRVIVKERREIFLG